MHYLRHLALIASTLLLMLTGSTTLTAQTETTSAAEEGRAHECPTTDRSAGTTTAPPGLDEYYLDDWRFGPE